MSVPVWMLLAFASWTILLLLTTIGTYRWSRILTGRVPIAEFRADHVVGEDWYKRSMRAHANCVENLPVFGAIVFALYVSELSGALIDALCVAVVIGRICQSLVHVSVPQTNAVVAVRFTFFFVQIISFIWLTILIVAQV
ncbi:MAPEG family protein [Proteobacteria bacterium 005FR1]|nr:MAPEG family protein [Proteobacteria bacterium 005FR1]